MRVPLVIVIAAVAASSCMRGGSGGGGGGGITTGAITSPGDPTTGVEFRIYAGGGFGSVALPNMYGVAARQLGDEVQRTFQMGWMKHARVGDAMVFARLMVDVISWQSVMDTTTLSAFSPTADLGIAPFGNGICITTSAGWDVHFNAPDRMLLGVFAGLCGGSR